VANLINMITPLFPHPFKTLLRCALILQFSASTTIFASSATASPVGSASVEHPRGTAADHLTKAEESRRAAAAFRQDAARYRQELEKEKKGIAILPKGPENPWWRKARLHYEPLIEDAERSAAEADRLAEYHRFRAAELLGLKSDL
jgi:hypothetical protein